MLNYNLNHCFFDISLLKVNFANPLGFTVLAFGFNRFDETWKAELQDCHEFLSEMRWHVWEHDSDKCAVFCVDS